MNSSSDISTQLALVQPQLARLSLTVELAIEIKNCKESFTICTLY